MWRLLVCRVTTRLPFLGRRVTLRSGARSSADVCGGRGAVSHGCWVPTRRFRACFCSKQRREVGVWRSSLTFPAHAEPLNPVREPRVTVVLQGGWYWNSAAGSGPALGSQAEATSHVLQWWPNSGNLPPCPCSLAEATTPTCLQGRRRKYARFVPNFCK